MFRISKAPFSVVLLGAAGLSLVRLATATTTGDTVLSNILDTSPIWADSASFHNCSVENVTTSNVTVTITLIDVGGNVINSAANVNIAAGSEYAVDDSSGSGWARCRFSLNDSPSSIRATGTVFKNNGNGTYQPYVKVDAR